MLTLRILPRNSIPCVFTSLQKLHTSIKLNNSKDESSSDSDSDTEAKTSSKPKEDFELPKSTKDNLENLLRQMTGEVKVSKTINISMPKDTTIKQLIKQEKENRMKESTKFNIKLKKAAKDVAKLIGGDINKTQAELLHQKSDQHTSEEKIDNLMSLIQGMKKKASHATDSTDSLEQAARAANVIFGTESTSKNQGELNRSKYQNIGLFKAIPDLELKNALKEVNPNAPEMKTWDLLEQQELNANLIHPPENYFEEMIQWTEKGILWHFPINNEQGMTSEDNVHFSEHVFMERHLKNWCPNRGPIRHFMELVCVGLSKNAFLTVEEKKEHIDWYRNYFIGKENLLKEIGAVPSKHNFNKITAGKEQKV